MNWTAEEEWLLLLAVVVVVVGQEEERIWVLCLVGRMTGGRIGRLVWRLEETFWRSGGGGDPKEEKEKEKKRMWWERGGELLFVVGWDSWPHMSTGREFGVSVGRISGAWEVAWHDGGR